MMEFYVTNKNHVLKEHLQEGKMLSVQFCISHGWSCQEATVHSYGVIENSHLPRIGQG